MPPVAAVCSDNHGHSHPLNQLYDGLAIHVSCRNNDNRNVPQTDSLELAQHLIAGDYGEHEIEKDEVGREGLDLAQGFSAILCPIYSEAFFMRDVIHQIELPFIVIRDEDKLLLRIGKFSIIGFFFPSPRPRLPNKSYPNHLGRGGCPPTKPRAYKAKKKIRTNEDAVRLLIDQS